MSSSLSVHAGAHLERNVLVVNPHFQLLLSDNVLLWPGRVVFPTNDQIPRSSNVHDAQAEATRGGGTDLVTSLSRMIRLNSSTTRGPTNTIGRNAGSMQSRRVMRIAMVMERNRNNVIHSKQVSATQGLRTGARYILSLRINESFR